MRLAALAGLSTFLIPAAAWAQPPQGMPFKPTILQVGGAVAINAEPYRGFDSGDTNIFPVPFILYRKGDLTVAGPQVSYALWTPYRTQISGAARYRFQNYDDADSPFLAGMGSRTGTVEIGVQARRAFGKFALSADGFLDIAGNHDGHELTANLAYNWQPTRKLTVSPSVGFAYQSENLIQYYFGVSPDDARLAQPVGNGTFRDRNAYVLDQGTINPQVGLQVRWQFKPRWTLFTTAQTAFLSDDITDSPIVEADVRSSALFGVSYTLKAPGLPR